MRDFNFPPPDTAADTFVAPVTNELPQTVLRDEEIRDEQMTAQAARPQFVEVEEDSNNNTARIIGGVVVGLLIIGGGIYAYEMTRATPVQQVALKAPTQTPAAMDQATAAPPPAAPDTSMAPPPAATPAATPSPKPSHPVVKQAANDNANAVTRAPAKRAAEDPAINAPMTLTPETAPPPQQPAAPAAQTALQQPLTAPNVTDQTNQPAPAMANNVAPQTVQPQIKAPLAPVPPGEIPADQAQQPNAQ